MFCVLTNFSRQRILLKTLPWPFARPSSVTKKTISVAVAILVDLLGNKYAAKRHEEVLEQHFGGGYFYAAHYVLRASDIL